MFKKEFKVSGEVVKGQVFGNWSTKSHYALKITELRPTLDEQDLDILIQELTSIKDKVVELNKEYNENKGIEFR